MDAEERLPAAAVAPVLDAPALEGAAARLPFFALVGLLERAAGRPGVLGSDAHPAEEPVRFSHAPQLAFSAADVARVSAVAADLHRDAHYEVVTSFLGLTGSVTPLPSYLAEEVAQEAQESPLRQGFLDVFHHRLLALLYRGVSGQVLASGARADAEDAWSRRLLALAGFDRFAEDRGPLPLAPGELLRLASLLATRARSARTLEVALEDLLGEELGGGRVRVLSFVPRWVDIPEEQRSRLPAREGAEGGGRPLGVQLGRTLVLGGRVRDCSGRFELELGPVTQAVYRRLLPGGDLARRVAAVVAAFTREPLAFGLVVRLPREEAPVLRLGTREGGGLGRDTWLGRPLTAEMRVRLEGAGD